MLTLTARLPTVSQRLLFRPRLRTVPSGTGAVQRGYPREPDAMSCTCWSALTVDGVRISQDRRRAR